MKSNHLIDLPFVASEGTFRPAAGLRFCEKGFLATIALVLLLSGCVNPQSRPQIPQDATSTEEPLLTNTGDVVGTVIQDSTLDVENEPLFQILVAEFAGQRGKLELAVEKYLAAAKALRSLDVAERAARIAVFARQYDAAIEATEIWVERAPKDPEARQILAAMYIRQGNAEEARRHLEAVLNSDGEGADRQLRMIVNLLGREQDKQTALTVMGKLLDTRPEDVEANVAFALLAIRAEKLPEAGLAMDKVAALGALDANLAMAYVALLQKQNKTREALGWLDKTLEQAPKDDGLRMIYARLLADANRYRDAREQFQILAKRSPKNSDVLYALGLLNLQAEEVAEAEAMFERLIKLNTRKDDALFYLGQIRESEEKIPQALTHYRAVNGGQNHFQAQVRVAVLLSNLSQVEAARSQLKSIRAETNEQKKHLVRAEAEILIQNKQLSEAMAVYDQALEEEYDMELLYTRAMLAEQMGRLDILERDLKQIIEREPNNSQALNALGYTLADRTDRHNEALELIERAYEISPDDFYILDSLGWVMYRLGRFSEAVTYLEQAREIRNDPEVAAHLGEVLWVMGNKEEARALLQNALRDTPNDQRLLEVIKRLEP